MSITIPDAVRQMLAIVDKLCVAYPHKKFTLDGGLVGDIGDMKPRPFAAEEPTAGSTRSARSRCFNEAAAFRRGRARSTRAASGRRRGFNEAAAFRRGRDRRDVVEELALALQ